MKKETNFLWKLKNDGIIDHMTVAYWISVPNEFYDGGPASKSSIKFGSMDSIGFRSTNYFIYRTKNKTTWDLRCSDFKDRTDSYGEADVRFEPSLPYLYLP